MSNTRTTTPPKGRPTPPRARQARPAAPTIKFKGKEYRVADKVGVWPLMQLARAAESGLTLGDQKGLAAAHAMLQDVIHPDDWGQFQEDMIAGKITDMDELLEACRQATELVSERMTRNGRSNGRRPGVAKAEIEE
jgi:hypothetical protein